MEVTGERFRYFPKENILKSREARRKAQQAEFNMERRWQKGFGSSTLQTFAIKYSNVSEHAKHRPCICFREMSVDRRSPNMSLSSLFVIPNPNLSDLPMKNCLVVEQVASSLTCCWRVGDLVDED